MTVLMTGFPGFLGSALLPRILRRTGDDAVCIVQPRYRDEAVRRAAALVTSAGMTERRIRLVDGDITEPGFGLADLDAVTRGVTEVWHLAAVYDITVPRQRAMRVNVDGTRTVLDVAERCDALVRFHHVSTCFVSGRYAGAFAEDDLDVGAPFNNFYEETKHLGEALVRARMASGLPATIYRPSIAVGDSGTGETQKFDGPYFAFQWLLRQPRVAVLPVVGDPSMVRVNVVPRDFVVDAVDHLGGLAHSRGRTYQVADPNPLTIDRMVEVIADAIGRRIVCVPLPRRLAKGAVRHVPGVGRLMRIPAELVDYFALPTHYLTDHLREDLEGSGIAAPPFESYVRTMVAFMRGHPEVGSAAMA